jgi:hypothetical protein
VMIALIVISIGASAISIYRWKQSGDGRRKTRHK